MEVPISPEQKKEIDKLFDEVVSSRKELGPSFLEGLDEFKEKSNKIREYYDERTRHDKEADERNKVFAKFTDGLDKLVSMKLPNVLWEDEKMNELFQKKDKEALVFLIQAIVAHQSTYLYKLEQYLQKTLENIKFKGDIWSVYGTNILKLDFDDLSKLLTDEQFEKEFWKKAEEHRLKTIETIKKAKEENPDIFSKY